MPLYETTKETVVYVIKELLLEGHYSKIYLSFGSKYNQPQVIYDSPHIQTRNTNATFQMLPAFLRDDPKILSICIDDFSNIENKEINREQIGSVIKDSIDFVFVDWKIDIPSFYIFLSSFLDILIQYNIPSQHFYCIFFLKFIRPNSSEESFSEKIEELAMGVFKDSIYRNSLYIWFGYQPNLYNCIYPAYYPLLHYSYMIALIQKRFAHNILRPYDIELWLSIVEPNLQARLIPFLKNCFDITKYSSDGNLWPLTA